MENDQKEQVDAQEKRSTDLEKKDVNEEGASENSEQENYRAKLNMQNRFLEKEGYKFENGGWVKPQSVIEKKAVPADYTLTPKDAMLIAKSNIDIEDVDEVVDYAKYRKIPVSEALKDKTLQGILADKVEERKTALATQTGRGRVSNKATNESLLEQAQGNQLPTDDSEIDRLAEARMEAKKKKK